MLQILSGCCGGVAVQPTISSERKIILKKFLNL